MSALYLLVINLTGIGFGATAAALVSDHVLHDENRIGDGVAWVAAVGLPLAALLLYAARRHYRFVSARYGATSAARFLWRYVGVNPQL